MFRNERRPDSCPPGFGDFSADNSHQLINTNAPFMAIPVLPCLLRFVPVITVFNIIVIVVIL
jgi:hypothetical protein